METVQPDVADSAPAASVFDVSALDNLVYTDGTVSAWLEYDCGNGIMTSGTNQSYLQVAVGTDYTHFQDYCVRMSQNANYTSVYKDNEYGCVGDSSAPVTYARYNAADGSHMVYVYILNALNEVRVIVDTNADMTGVYANGFVYESTTGETAQPMMVMYGLSMAENGYHIDTSSTQYCTDKVNSGALIVIRMPDNSLFINDGGSVEQWNDDTCDRFMTFLREMTGKSEGEKVVINTWFLSHAHTDHFEGFTRFVDHYYDQIDLQSVMYNIDSERLGTARDLTDVLHLFRAYFPAVKYYKPHTGERFNIAGVEFDVIYTQEDRFYPTSNGQQLLIDHLDGKSEYADHDSRNGTYRAECFFETVYSYDKTNDVLVSTPTTYDYSDFNDTSTVLKVTFPAEIIDASEDMSAILYADVNRVDQTILTVYEDTDMLKANIMMIPHHGHDAHPELAQVSEADVFLYTQRASAIYGPNGIADYGVDVGGTYRPVLVYNYLAMQEHIETGKIYWQGTETVCLTFGADAQSLPAGMTRDESLSASTGIYAYTCDAIDFKYEGWTLLTNVSGSNASSNTGVEITMKRIRFDQVTSLKNEGRYLIVHDQTDNVLMYNAIAQEDGQSKPNLAISMEVGSGQAASDGLVDAYYKVSDTNQPDVETKTSIYCTRDKRDAALWILGQDGITGSDTALNTATAKFGGTIAYSATTLYKGTASDDAYWYSTKDNDYVDSSAGNQWRYLRASGSPLFHNAQTVTNWIEFFEDGTCLIYYYESSSNIRFLSITPEGNWVRSKKVKTSQVTGDLLDSLKLRMYEYKTRSGAKTIAYSGPQSYEVLKGTGKKDIINSIASTFHVMDSSARNRAIPCSGTTAKVGYYWLDGTISASSVSSLEVTLKYRNDDGTDSVICAISIHVLDSLYLDTVISSTHLTVDKDQTDTDGKVCEVYRNTDGYVTIDSTIVLDMLTDADGNPATSNTGGEVSGLTLTYNGQILATDILLTVVADVTQPGFAFSGASLVFEDEIFYQFYFIPADTADVVEYGIITFTEKLADGTHADAVDVIPGAVAQTNGTYMVRTNGIPAKEMGDWLYFRVYAKLSDGSYAYATTYGYRATAYANTVLSGNSDAKTKALMVAMLNYGAAAQTYFSHNTDSLMNASLTEAQKALVEPYRSDMIGDIVTADSSKTAAFPKDTACYASGIAVGFEGAFAVNYYFTPKHTPDGELTMYYWDAATYNSISEMTRENATSVMTLEKQTDGSYLGAVEGIAAKEVDSTIYVALVYTSGGTEYCSGILAYSLGTYFKSVAGGSSTAQPLGAAVAVYSYYAKQYFAN